MAFFVGMGNTLENRKKKLEMLSEEQLGKIKNLRSASSVDAPPAGPIGSGKVIKK
jgi:hypothetical protein